MSLVLNWFADPGHAWLRVEVSELIQLGIADKVSRYSYVGRNGQYAYLEEDCDAGLYIQARNPEGPIEWNHKEYVTDYNTGVRSMRHYDYETVMRGALKG